jgi:hypothetical protein
MNKTNAVLVAVIVILVAAFAVYVSKHPATSPEAGSTQAVSASTANAPEAAEPRTLNADLEALGVDKLALDVGVGEVRVNPSPDGKIHVQVTLRPKEQEFMWFFHWRSEGTARGIAAASINQERSGERLSLSLNYPRGADQQNLKQEWDVQVPVRLALDANLKVGELSINGVEGGVTARLDVGELSIDAPQGAIDGQVNVGEIRAKSGSDRYGKIDLSSTIGEAVVYINGEQSGFHEHGGLGNRVTLDGTGPDTLQLKVNIGEVALHLTPDDAARKGSGK